MPRPTLKFGHSIAGENLSKILEEQGEIFYNRKCSRIFNDFSAGLRDLEQIKRRRTYIPLLDCWKAEIVRRIKQAKLPEIIKTHLANAITAMVREAHRTYLCSEPDIRGKLLIKLKRAEEKHKDILDSLAGASESLR